uniref:hypothetical protein n=1 Tax=uncultured Microscilla sp. TaxID=432653 RepID=UPI00261C5566
MIKKEKVNQLLSLPFSGNFLHHSFDLEYDFFKEIFFDDSKPLNRFLVLLKESGLNQALFPPIPYILHSLHSSKKSVSVLTNREITKSFFTRVYKHNIFHFDLVQKFSKLLLSSSNVPYDLKEAYQTGKVTTPYFWNEVVTNEALSEELLSQYFYRCGVQPDYQGLARLRGIETSYCTWFYKGVITPFIFVQQGGLRFL